MVDQVRGGLSPAGDLELCENPGDVVLHRGLGVAKPGANPSVR